jgi:hypothetical protein
MPSADLSGFGKAMFEKRMRERNMGQDPFRQFRMPTQADEVFKRFGTSQMIMDPKLRDMVRDGTVNLDKATRTEGQPFNNRFKDAIKGFSGLGSGFDNSALMQDPKFRQMDTMNQGMEVSEPYFEANKQAFSKNNPMNAISQETPVGDRVDAFIKGIARGTGGVADYMTGGLTDLDQKGDMPYQKRIKQRLGGLADFATLGITDFDGRSR